MAEVPKSKKMPDVFKVFFDGYYGRFKTKNSYALEYLLTIARVGDLKHLQTAAKAFPFESIHFDQLIQRDIDFERVDSELVDEYLLSDKPRVLFFPPLLGTFVSLDESGITAQYQTSECHLNPEETAIIRTWDSDKFLLELPCAEISTGYVVDCKGKPHDYIPYAATLKFNPDRVKLVVIDGQHRFAALQRIIERNQQEHIEELEIPLCIFFTPDAVKDSNETILRDLRELFVTINQTSKQVSGHFLTLLNDRSLASHCVRALADKWKESDPRISRLPLLEWNTRDTRRAGQRTKVFSITTVTIIGDVLTEYVFATKEPFTEILLNLKSRENDLQVEGTPAPTYDQLGEDNFHVAQIKVLTEQLKEHVVPAIEILLQKPRPFNLHIERVNKAKDWLWGQVDKEMNGARVYRDDVFLQFRRTTEKDLPSVREIERGFEGPIEKGMPEEDEVYFLNVFQQGLIRAWAKLCGKLVLKYEVSPAVVAESLVRGMELLVWAPEKRYFGPDRPHLQEVIYRGQRVVVKVTSRESWMNLILAALRNTKVLEACLSGLRAGGVPDGRKDAVKQDLLEIARAASHEYVDAYEDAMLKDIKKHYFLKGFDEREINKLRELERTDEEEFVERVRKLASTESHKGLKVLANLIGVNVAELTSDA